MDGEPLLLPPSAFAEALVSEGGLIVEANPGFAEVFGFAAPIEAVGRVVSADWVFEERVDRAALRVLAAGLLESGRPYAVAAAVVRPDGSRVPFVVRALPWGVGPTSRPQARLTFVVSEAGLSAAERWEAEAIRAMASLTAEWRAVATARQRQAALAGLGGMAMQGAPIGRLLAHGAEIVWKELAVSEACVHACEADGRGLALRTRAGRPASPEDSGSIEGGLRHPLGLAVAVGQPVVARDPGSDERFDTPGGWQGLPPGSVLAAPIQGGGRTWGTLCAANSVVREFSADEVAFVRTAANIMGGGLAREAAEGRIRSLAAMVEAAPLLVGSFAGDGGVDYLNAEARRALGIGPSEPLDSTRIGELIRPVDDRLALETPEAVMSGRLTTTLDCTCIPCSGGTFIASVTVQAASAGDRAASRFNFFASDITERLRSRRQLEASLAEVQRLARHLRNRARGAVSPDRHGTARRPRAGPLGSAVGGRPDPAGRRRERARTGAPGPWGAGGGTDQPPAHRPGHAPHPPGRCASLRGVRGTV